MGWGQDAWARLAELPVRVDRVELSFPSITVSSGWERVTTVVALHGDGEIGLGEDVTYEADEHRAIEAAGPPIDPTGEHTLGEFWGLTTVAQFPEAQGRLAAEALLRELDGEEVAKEHFSVPIKLVVRRSTRALQQPLALRFGQNFLRFVAQALRFFKIGLDAVSAGIQHCQQRRTAFFEGDQRKGNGCQQHPKMRIVQREEMFTRHIMPFPSPSRW